MRAIIPMMEIVFSENDRSCRKNTEDQIDIRIGAEIGMQPYLAEYYQDFMAQHPFDFVIGSVHSVLEHDPWRWISFRSTVIRKDIRSILRKCFRMYRRLNRTMCWDIWITLLRYKQSGK